jgi:GPH family glycoside/pentoside/hexuronide:cation symporter
MSQPDLTHSVTSDADRILLMQKLAYAIGMLVNNLQAAALPALMIVLNLGLGMDPVWVGIIGFAPRIVDAISDPLMGFISDKTRSRWGRRRPYIFIGALISGIVFAMMWQLPEGRSQNFYFYSFLAFSILYFLTYTMYATPFVAFGYEMTADYHERTRLHAFANTAGQLAWIIAPWFWWLMSSDYFEDTVEGSQVIGMWVGALIMVGIVPAIFCREKMDDLATASDDQSTVMGQTFEFFAGIKTTLQCRPFVQLCAATFLVFNGFQLGMSFALYVMIYYVFGGENSPAGALNGRFGSSVAFCTIAVIPLTAWISTKVGKRNTFLITISLSIVGYLLKWVGYNPDHPNWLLASAPLVAFGTGSLFTLMGSMVSDVCDYDELVSHERREGIFGAIYWWMVKVGMALAGLLTGILLNVSGFDVALTEGQSDQTLLLLRIFDVFIPVVSSLIALAIIYQYDITETRANEIRPELEQRRGKLNG